MRCQKEILFESPGELLGPSGPGEQECGQEETTRKAHILQLFPSGHLLTLGQGKAVHLERGPSAGNPEGQRKLLGLWQSSQDGGSARVVRG